MNLDLIKERKQLAETIAKHAQGDGDHQTRVPGLTLTRRSVQTACYRAHCVPGLAVFAQGKKRMELGGIPYECDASSFFLSSIEVPIQSQVVEANKKEPLLTMRIDLDMDAVRETINREDFILPKGRARGRGLAVGTSTAGLLSACIRLVSLLDAPEDIPYLNPLIQREIIYRILRTPQAQGLRSIVTHGDLSARTARVMSWLRRNYAKTLRMEELAEEAHMGVSTLHHQFRALTSMSPLQYQKQIRLQKARERMLMDGLDATSAAYEVGYGSVPQFNREYSRHFGMPPMRDIKLTKERQEAVTLET